MSDERKLSYVDFEDWWEQSIYTTADRELGAILIGAIEVRGVAPEPTSRRRIASIHATRMECRPWRSWNSGHCYAPRAAKARRAARIDSKSHPQCADRLARCARDNEADTMTQQERIDRWERIVNMAESYIDSTDLTDEESPEDEATARADVAWARNLFDIAREQLFAADLKS